MCFINNFRKNGFNPIGYSFCNDFPNDITKANRSEFSRNRGFRNFWYKANKSVIYKVRSAPFIENVKGIVNNIWANYILVFIIKHSS